MKIDLKSLKKPTQQKRVYEAPVPLERPGKKEIAKEDLLRFKLRSVPADVDSPVYESSVPIFERGTPEEVLNFIKNVQAVITGQNLTVGPPKYTLMRRLLRGDALAAFNAGATAAGNETNPHFVTACNALVQHFFPQRALALQKRVMRRFIRKPKDMTMRDFMGRMTEINDKLDLFPPFGANQKLSDDELLDIGEFGTPNSWQRQMIVQDFDPLAGTSQDLIEFCERMERTETLDAPIPKKASKTKSGPSSTTTKEPQEEMWCELCEMNNHPTSKCYKLKKLKREMQGKREASSNDREAKRTRREHGQPRTANNTYLTREEANALMKRVIKKHYGDAGGLRKRKKEDLGAVEDDASESFSKLSLSSSENESDESSTSSDE